MSIRAMNWAMGARTDGVSAQCVLFVVADTANEHGISIHADPDYIAARTRQSRATVFRRLKELEQSGALTRLKRFREDGAPVYEIRLKLDAEIDYDTPPDDGGAAQDIEAESQIETHPESHPETGTVSPVRQAESQSCDSIGPSKNPEREESPQAPLRGVTDQSSIGGEAPPAEIEGWPEFKSAWEADGIPMARPGLVKPLLGALTLDERGRLTKAAKGYLHHRSREKKPGTKLSAQNFVREIEAWDGWAKHAPADVTPPTFIAEHSPEHEALLVLYAIIDASPPQLAFDVPQVKRGFWRKHSVPPDLLGLSLFTGKPRDQWAPVERGTNPFGAWAQRIEKWTGRRPEPQRVETGGEHPFTHNGVTTMVKNYVIGLRVPHPFPPNKDGSISSSTDPPKESSAA